MLQILGIPVHVRTYLHTWTNLVLPVVGLGVLNDSVAQSEQVVHGLIPLACQLSHLEGGLLPQGDPQQVEDLMCI